MSADARTRRYYAVVLCLMVLVFFVHAKLPTSSGSMTSVGGYHPVASSQKIDSDKAGKLLPILLLLVVLVTGKVPPAPKARRPRSVPRPSASRVSFDPVRFLRPPPISVPSLA